jgi:flagellar hook assembly protein FlgD
VTLIVYNAAGRVVRTLVDEQRPAGTNEVVWDGRNENGDHVASGVYFCRVAHSGWSAAGRMVLLK